MERRGRLRLLVSTDGADGSLIIGQDARLHAGLLDGDESIEQQLEPGRAAWLHMARGSLALNGHSRQAGDGAALLAEERLQLTGGRAAEFVLWDLPHPDQPFPEQLS